MVKKSATKKSRIPAKLGDKEACVVVSILHLRDLARERETSLQRQDVSGDDKNVAHSLQSANGRGLIGL